MDGAAKLVKGVQSVEFQVNRWLNTVVSIAIFLLMLLITADVGGRFFFNKPIQGTLEISESVLVIAAFGAVAFYQLTRGHVELELLYNHLNSKGKKWCDFFVAVIAAVSCSLMAWSTYKVALFSESIKLTGSYGGEVSIPTWIPQAFISIGFLLLAFHFWGSFFLKTVELTRSEKTS